MRSEGVCGRSGRGGRDAGGERRLWTMKNFMKYFMSIVFILILGIMVNPVICNSIGYGQETEKEAIENFINKYLDLVTTPPQATMEAAKDVLKDLASLFDFANMEGPPAVQELVSKYNQTLSVEVEAPLEDRAKYEEARRAIQDIFFANYLQAFQQARINRTGSLKREESSIQEITLLEDSETVIVKIKDNLGLATLKLHKRDNTWLIYSVENPK